jgi:hypothetical protein
MFVTPIWEMLCQRPALWPVIFIKNKIAKNLFDEILKLKF